MLLDNPAFTQSTDRGPSNGLWNDAPSLDSLRNNPTLGWFHDDDFVDFGLPGTQTTEINLGRYKVYNTGAGKVITDSMPTATGTATGGGIISMLCDTAGDQSVIGTHSCPFSLRPSAGGKLWFEARIATTSIATNMSHIFIGLGNNADVTFGAAIPLADADATGTAVALLGFTRLEDGLGVLNTSYTDEAASYTHVQTSAGSIAANAWRKVGFTYDPYGGSSALQFYVNGTKCTTALSATTLAALTHLNASGLGLVFAQFADSAGTGNYAYLDWWRCVQVPADNTV